MEKFFFQIKTLSNIITGGMKKIIGVFCHQNFSDFCSEFFGWAINLFCNCISWVLCLLLYFSLIFKAFFLEKSTGKLCSHQEIYPGILIAFVCKKTNNPLFSSFHISLSFRIFSWTTLQFQKNMIYHFEVSFKTIGNILCFKCIK